MEVRSLIPEEQLSGQVTFAASLAIKSKRKEIITKLNKFDLPLHSSVTRMVKY